jgi:hypothetical protein
VAAGGQCGDLQCGAFNDGDGGDVDDLLQSGGVTLQESEQVARGRDLDFSLQALADALGLARLFEHAQGLIAHSKDLLPLF